MFIGKGAHHKVLREAEGIVEDEYIAMGRRHELPGHKATVKAPLFPGISTRAKTTTIEQAPTQKWYQLRLVRIGAGIVLFAGVVGGIFALNADSAEPNSATTTTTTSASNTTGGFDLKTFLQEDAKKDSSARHLFERTFTENLLAYGFPVTTPYAPNCLNNTLYDVDQGSRPHHTDSDPDVIVVMPGSGDTKSQLRFGGEENLGGYLYPADIATKQALRDMGCYATTSQVTTTTTA